MPAISAYQDASRGDWRKPREWFAFHTHSALQALALRWAGSVVVFSDNMRRQVERFTQGNVSAHVISPGVDQARFRPPNESERFAARRALGLPERGSIILGLGRFARVKGYERGIKALQNLPGEVFLVLVGSGPCEQEYRQTAKKFGVSERVIIHARTSTPEEYYHAANVFLFTSVHEPFGQVLLEASCSGLPVVAFRPGSGVETATEEIYRGLDSLVHWANADQAASLPQAVMQALISQRGDSERSAKDARQLRKRFSWETTVYELSRLERGRN